VVFRAEVGFDRGMPSLILGPALRYVGRDCATVWVETDVPCTVRVLGSEEPTFEVSGHHYALVQVRGLEPGTTTEYEVHLDDDRVWPGDGSTYPPSVVRTLDPGRPQRITFGSCRFSTQRSVKAPRRYGVDALDAYARRTLRTPRDGWPDLLLMLGDQVYADDTSKATRERIARKRDIHAGPKTQVADFEEYTWLYQESWGDPEIRWLMSTVPTAMIFDDHDVHDDWNSSRLWRQNMQATPWWQERITGALVSYWVYQHLGNLSPEELEADATYAKVRAAAGEDVAPILRPFAQAADREADGAKGYRWSHWRDLGTTRLVVLDSRCGRILDGTPRSILSDAEFAWIEERLDGDYDHLLIGTSVPWLLSPAMYTIEAWNERMADHRNPRRAKLGEKLRVGTDLEHWPAFHRSFERFARMIAEVAAGRRGSGAAPATVCVLSGDVHHSYVARADYSATKDAGAILSNVYQLTCSPVHNWVPTVLNLSFRATWNGTVEHVVRILLSNLARVPRPPLRWRRVDRIVFGNAIATLVLEGRAARVVIESSRDDPDEPLVTAVAADLSSARD
jgi:hypothetical protein